MKRTLLCASALLALSACQGGPDARPGTVPAPLPEKVQKMPYGQLLERSRSLAKSANEAFYVDNWENLEESASGLEQVALYLVAADDVPLKHRDTIKTTSADLGKAAKELRTAAAAKDVNKTTEAMTKVQRVVREMRLGDGL
jgi:hypothetical protein